MNKMNWQKLLSPVRFGKESSGIIEPEHARSEFQRDYDRLIFSSPFRRLQNKTQVFPLPGSVFVHNRLTHSLEVASVGRSLGNLVIPQLKKKYDASTGILIDEIGSIIAAASLSHDLGNPPFGHSGEKAISSYFTEGKGQFLKDRVNEKQWNDLVCFEGNANALRLLTHQFNGRRFGGFSLTHATLASLIKYPYASVNRTKKNKYGYFESETDTFKLIAKQTGMLAMDEKEDSYYRHPLVFLVEAADDISYGVMDIEDAHKLGILDTDFTTDLLMLFFDKVEDAWFYEKKEEIYQQVTDRNERIAFLRASVINLLVTKAAKIFCENEEAILEGRFTGSLVDYYTGTTLAAMKQCAKVGWEKIYQHRSVVEIEITGYNVLTTLIEEFTQAAFNPDKGYAKKLLALLPMQYQKEHEDDYGKIRSVLDFISGMTDLYAVELYKLIKGISI